MEDLTKNFNGRGCQCFRKTTQPVAGRPEAERLCQCSRTPQDTHPVGSQETVLPPEAATPRPKRNREPTGQDWAEGPGGVNTAPLPRQRPVLPAVHAQLEGQVGRVRAVCVAGAPRTRSGRREAWGLGTDGATQGNAQECLLNKCMDKPASSEQSLGGTETTACVTINQVPGSFK